MLEALALAALIQSCAPDVGPRTVAAVIAVESGGHPWRINSNTARRSFTYPSRAAAQAAAGQMLRAGHNIDLGLMQVNSRNLVRLGLTPETVFEPCTNVRAGARILREAYERAEQRFGPGQRALRHALSAYNTGSLYRGARYVNKVLAKAQMAPDACAVLGCAAEAGASARSASPLTAPLAAAGDTRRVPTF